MPAFDPATYQVSGKASACAGFAMANHVSLTRFEALLDAPALAEIATSLAASTLDPVAAQGWRYWLIYEACLQRYGSFGAVVEALDVF